MVVRCGQRWVTGSSGWLACSNVVMCSTAALRNASSLGSIGLLKRSLNRGICSASHTGLYKFSSSKSVWMSFFTTGVGSSSSLSGTTGVGSYAEMRLYYLAFDQRIENYLTKETLALTKPKLLQHHLAYAALPPPLHLLLIYLMGVLLVPTTMKYPCLSLLLKKLTLSPLSSVARLSDCLCRTTVSPLLSTEF